MQGRWTVLRQILPALLFGLAVMAVSAWQLDGRGHGASDFSYPRRAASRLFHGQNPYRDPSVGGGHSYPFEMQFPYPLPTAVLAAPFTLLPPVASGALFAGVSCALLAFGLLRYRPHQAPLLLSAPLWVAVSVAQWTPALLATAVIPALLPLAVTKPNLGGPLLLLSGRPRAWLMAALILASSLALRPTWPLDWLRGMGDGGAYVIPLAVLPVGPAMLLLLRYRQLPEARLALLLALVPQKLFWYDQAALGLLPHTSRQAWALTAAGWGGYIGWAISSGASPLLRSDIASMPGSVTAALPWIMLSTFLPALVLVLRQARAREAEPAAKPDETVPVAA